MGIKADLEGKTALVTGGTRGIGRAISLELARSGANVAVASRTQKDLKLIQEEIEGIGALSYAAPCDISSLAEIQKMVEDVYAWQGRIDLLVNCAGINLPLPALEVTEEIWDKTLDINLKGVFFCSQAVAKKMISHKGGNIINITSQLSFIVYEGRAAYCASKSGLTQISKVLALEWAPYNIRVNCVAPTFTRTPMTEAVFSNPEAYKKVVSRIPLGRAGKPEDYTGAVLYLASDSAGLVTGTTILVDGGWTLE